MFRPDIPNPALVPFSVLIGNWNTTGTHRLVPDTILSTDDSSWEKDLELTYTRVE